jgi:cytochrome c biogenesis protein CcmG/thiol:disulfide interchange protein DsbE
MKFDRRQLLALIPLGFVSAMGFAFWKMLDRMQAGKFDPHDIGTPLMGKKIPDFNLPGVGGAPGFDSAALRAAAAQGPLLVNFFASWCIPCAQEADLLGTLGAEGIPIWGIVYEDKDEAAKKYLDQYGNPYRRLACDVQGRTAIDWGVDGVPETFVLDRSGVVRWHKAGPLTDDSVRQELRPALRAVA